ncbi:NAD(P)/FAD-dependent oxidoreductase [Streptomyces phaeolivaceus]|uniref:NAD(P)/FAD-dependent oxidoreductase n=1 Tax=Streptomyces phaeolivaceus TaxID=2653200 RepID=UPI001869B283|nr:FAD-dependent oxidoreductase [Streptomyces phaeolivaceus]
MKVVVIGAGSLGLGAASRLVEAPGADVVVLDKQHAAAGSSGRSAGVFSRLYNDAHDIALRIRTIELIEQLADTQGLTLRRIGLLRLARTPQDLDALAASLETQTRLGVRSSRLLTPGELPDVVPISTEGVLGAIHNAEDGYLDGAELCGAMAAKIREHGGQVRGQAEVTSVVRRPASGFRLELADGTVLDADVVVNAAGAWAGPVGDLLDAPVAMANERHEAFVLQLPKAYAGPVLPMTMDYVVGADDPGVYFRHEGKDQVIAGMHSNSVVGHTDGDPEVSTAPTDEGAEEVLERLARLLPDIEFGYRGGWTGIYPHSRTGTFVVGEHPATPGVFVVAGGGGIGVNMGPVLGEIVADQILYGASRRFQIPDSWAPGR